MKFRTSVLLTFVIGLSACQSVEKKSIVTNAAMLETENALIENQASNNEYMKSILTWRLKRIDRLRSPDNWLSLVGLHWLEDGKYSIGRDQKNAIVLATGPANLGVIEVMGKNVKFSINPANAFAKIGDGLREAVLSSDNPGPPTQIRFGETDFESSFTLIERSNKLGLRVKDNRAKTRTDFIGVDYFEINPQYKVEASFTAHEPGKTIPIATVIGTLEEMKNPGRVSFELNGQTHTLEAIDEGDGQLFFIIADRTSGKETYGPGRFFYAEPAVDGKTILDFNKAYNPPCAFNAYSTCPLPPPENRLDATIRAGEKKYLGATH